MSVSWSETLDYDRRKSYVTCMTMICRGNPTCGADSPTASYFTRTFFISSTIVLMNSV